ncbi:uncharacterized protein si:ch211-12e13.1 [Synchiropus splendidus]|uniref:uncharacterized protein si:ch211-12e13.1 n=1 Tax=Synchiropus splendidus TaxID=270530 RepID=UPI00237ECD4C|nr:uncharacterized protein si:ch211-12e13.1 [Synchiropus splendidus]
MGNVHSYVVASATACSLYVIYAHIYCSHKLLHSREFRSDQLPSPSYLCLRYLIRSLSRTRGRLNATPRDQGELVCTVSHNKLEDSVLRRFCRAAGYGWDYPDSEYRDIPLCFPEFLCLTPLLIVLTDKNFRLSPAGLTRVRQTLRTHQPVDELKKGPFVLQVHVLEYRPVDAGVEVDVRLSAISRCQSLVWESVLTLVSTNKLSTTTSTNENERVKQALVCEDAKQVMVSAPCGSELHYLWSFSGLLSGPARLLGLRLHTAPSLWMLSVSLAEVEKHQGVGVITAPANVSVHFKRPLRAPGKINIQFGTQGKDGSLLHFRMLQPQDNLCHMEGVISRCL